MTNNDDSKVNHPANHLWARIVRVHQYIDDHLDHDLDLFALADIACLSPYHFHRVYVGLTGESVIELVRRKRLLIAADQLLAGKLTIDKIAENAGYSSKEAFSRSFGRAFSLPPQSWLKARDRHWPRTITPSILIGKQMTENFSTAEQPARKIAAIRHVGPYDSVSSTFQLVGQQAFAQKLFGPETKMIAISYDDPSETAPENCRTDCGLFIGEQTEVSAPMTVIHMPAHMAAIYRHIGSYKGLGAAWSAAYATLAQSGLVPSELAPYEIYQNNPMNSAEADLITDINIPIVG